MSTFHIEFQFAKGDEATLAPWLEKFATATLVHQSIEREAVLTILISDDEQLRELNANYRGEDKPTDVLSFEDGSHWPDGRLYLGDIAISLDTAEHQANSGGHAINDELALLTVHGVLHLLGHDHLETDEKERMWQAQGEILGSFGVTVQPTE